MEPAGKDSGAFIFGPFEYDESLDQLRKHGTILTVHGKPLQILSALLNKPGETISREELRVCLWGETPFGDFEQGLNSAVNKLRQALGDSADRPRYIETVPKKGYRFIAGVRQSSTTTVVPEAEAAAPLIPNASAVSEPESVARPRGPDSHKRRDWAMVAGGIILTCAIGISVWSYSRYLRARHVRTESLPKIRALVASGERVPAYDLLTASLRDAPEDPDLQSLAAEVAKQIKITTTPPGARLSYRQYGNAQAPWREIGITPIDSAEVPNGLLHFRAEKTGSPTIEVAALSPLLNGVNLSMRSLPEGMVSVPATARWDAAEIAPLPDYLIDQFEVSNAKFQKFVDAAGYRNPKYWKHLMDQRKAVNFEKLMNAFQDSTGRAGPSGWEVGAYPKNQSEYPVTGVSWFEAAAYCEFAGRVLPTVNHWRRAAGFGPQSTALLHSNFGGHGPAAVGIHTGISPFGAYDMSGNVKEWVWNQAGDLRYILGGSWNEPSYMFHDPDAQNPFLRDSHFGFRCAKYNEPPPAETLAPIPPEKPYHQGRSPVDDQTFEIYRRRYAYDPTPLEAKTEYREDKYEDWVKEKVTYRTVYGERMPAYLYLPKKGKPPYQGVVWVPGGYARFIPSSNGQLPIEDFSYLVTAGRAVLYPIYKGTYERRPTEQGPNVFRETHVQFVKDIFQAVSFLESRPEIDKRRIAFEGYSLGAWIGVMALALESRFQTGVLICGGLLTAPLDGELELMNFAPRIHTPILMVGGKDDFVRPAETSQRPLFNLLGTPIAEKRFALFDGGHIAPKQGMMRETLDWMDKHLGPVGK